MNAQQERPGKTRGGVLVEFALVSFALYLLLAAIIDLGRVVMAGQLLQSAADQMARELAVAPLPATMTFDQALETDYVKQRIYDPSKLFLQITPTTDIETLFDSLPVVNQMLRPLMVADVFNGQNVIRYPGAVVTMPSGDVTVMIPRISVEGGTTTLIDWVHVVEEILPDANSISHFPINAPQAAFRGNVILRLNYPFQAAAMSAFDPAGTEGPFRDVVSAPEAIADPDEGTVLETEGPTSVRGPGGLGYHYAFLNADGTPKRVLPFRKLISVRSIHRRENYGG